MFLKVLVYSSQTLIMMNESILQPVVVNSVDILPVGLTPCQTIAFFFQTKARQ